MRNISSGIRNGVSPYAENIHVRFVFSILIASVGTIVFGTAAHGANKGKPDGVSVSVAPRVLDACVAAKNTAHRERCPTLSQFKKVSQCSCKSRGSDYMCEVSYSATCRSLAPFSPAYVQTGTSEGASTVSQSLACDAAHRVAGDFSCFRGHLRSEKQTCVCDRLEEGWKCILDYKTWCM